MGVFRNRILESPMLRPITHFAALALLLNLPLAVAQANGDQQSQPVVAPPAGQARDKTPPREELEKTFQKMLSGATLEGTFTNTAEGFDPTKLSPEKYVLGKVKKVRGDYWLIPARIQYGAHDVTLPLILPVRWAGDTPMIVVDEVGLPGFGTVSARVMFFADHYAGYWKHGKSGGHLFGVIRQDAKDDAASPNNSAKESSPASTDPLRSEQKKKQSGKK
jgi:hypothetical protein